MILTILAYRNDAVILERDIETDCHDFRGFATGIRSRLDCSRVVIIQDGQFAFDTNDLAAA
jgi:hypothetical protein